jgi:hypothetical protein
MAFQLGWIQGSLDRVIQGKEWVDTPP